MLAAMSLKDILTDKNSKQKLLKALEEIAPSTSEDKGQGNVMANYCRPVGSKILVVRPGRGCGGCGYTRTHSLCSMFT